MSGFFAIVAAGRVDESVVRGVIDAGVHRGPARLWRGEGAVLGAFDDRRGVRISVGDDFVVALDGRFDTHPYVGGDDGDASVLLHLWRAEGARCLEKIVGDFAAAIWDRRSRHLTVVRDPVGGRPALVARSRGRVVAGSEIPMLLADRAVDRSVDERFVAAYLGTVGDYERTTAYRAIQRVAAGTLVRATASGWQERRWHEWRPKRIRERSDRAYAEGFLDVFDRSVRDRLRGVARAGVALSGGMDSTSIAVTARAVRPDLDLAGLAIPFESPEGDERELQRMVAQRSSARLRWVSLEGLGPFDDSPEDLFETFGYPPVPPNWFHLKALGAAARDEGVEVLFDGVDGDAVLTGGSGDHLSDLLVSGRWRTYLAERRSLLEAGVSRAYVTKDLTFRPLVPSRLWLAAKRVLGRTEIPDFMEPDFARRNNVERALGYEPWFPGRRYSLGQARAVGPAMLPNVLEVIEAVYSRYQIEVTHPFLDRRVVEYCLGLPREQKFAYARTKIVLRNAMAGRLPAEVTERAEKADLSAPLSAGLYGFQRPLVLEGLAAASTNCRQWIDGEGLQTLGVRFAHGRDGFAAYRVAAIGHWAKWMSRRRAIGAGSLRGQETKWT